MLLGAYCPEYFPQLFVKIHRTNSVFKPHRTFCLPAYTHIHLSIYLFPGKLVKQTFLNLSLTFWLLRKLVILTRLLHRFVGTNYLCTLLKHFHINHTRQSNPLAYFNCWRPTVFFWSFKSCFLTIHNTAKEFSHRSAEVLLWGRKKKKSSTIKHWRIEIIITKVQVTNTTFKVAARCTGEHCTLGKPVWYMQGFFAFVF